VTPPPAPALPPPTAAPIEKPPEVRPAAPAGTWFEGRVYIDEKAAGAGYRVVFRNLTEGKVLESGATSAEGVYTREVVLGQRYRFEKVVGPGGVSFSPRGQTSRMVREQAGPIVWDVNVYSGGQ
jgi:hypothetical protein